MGHCGHPTPQASGILHLTCMGNGQPRRFTTAGGTARPSSADSPLPRGTGYDGTTGDQPRGTKVWGNVVREIGMNERQSSAWSEAKACSSHVKGNLFFNLPRAAINKNDGFGGGTLIEKNLLVNTCRESGDHGPFNSWDRQPFLTTVGDGKTASLVPAYNTITVRPDRSRHLRIMFKV